MKIRIGFCWFALAVSFALQASAVAQQVPHASEEVVLRGGVSMLYEQNVAVPMPDGATIFANVFRPKKPGRYPVIMAQGPYGKDATFQAAYAGGWAAVVKTNPKICDLSSCRFMRWEHTDPERWVADGYVVIALDVRGAGYTTGYLDMFSPRETRDFADAIEWAGTQPWSSGKVGLLGISYLAINQWHVAALQPAHLAAIAPWEGASDVFRESGFHGGIESNLFVQLWFKSQILPNQNGNGTTRYRDPTTDMVPTGVALDETTLARNRSDPFEQARAHPLLDAFNVSRNAVLSRIKVPLLSAGNLAAAGLHGRGNYEGFLQAASPEKRLFLHTGTHDDNFYSDEGVALQHRFFDHYLKGVKNGWDGIAPVTLAVRDPSASVNQERTEQSWPLARTQWTKFHLDADAQKLTPQAPAPASKSTFDAGKSAATFELAFDQKQEITGPLAAHLWIASTTTDADFFVTLQLMDPQGKEVTFLGASDDASPLAQGWLRASQRKLDVQRSRPYQPWHTHDQVEKLIPGEFYPVDVEIWPTSIVIPQGYKLVLRIEGADFQRPAVPGAPPFAGRGSGIFLHTDPTDRPLPEFGGVTSIATGAQHDSYLTLPLIPVR